MMRYWHFGEDTKTDDAKEVIAVMIVLLEKTRDISNNSLSAVPPDI